MRKGLLLEMMVECLQKLLAGDDMSVTRGEKFHGNGRKIAEVDVVLRGRFGSSDMLIGIECRDRSKPQGTEWIQQIIGKRDDLYRFGFTNWVAVSSSGFTVPARELASLHGIDLLVPAKVTPEDPKRPGLLEQMHLDVVSFDWFPTTFQATISHDDDNVLSYIKEKLQRNGGWDTVRLGRKGTKEVSLSDYIRPSAEAALKNAVAQSGGEDFQQQTKLRFDSLEAALDNKRFTITEIYIDVELIQKTVESEFEMMGFVNSTLKNLIGIIGINTYRMRNHTAYVMLAIKPDGSRRATGLVRTENGDPISGTIVFKRPKREQVYSKD